jgi:hypothetical protein
MNIAAGKPFMLLMLTGRAEHVRWELFGKPGVARKRLTCIYIYADRLEIPDELTPPGQDHSRAALEAIGLEACRQRRISGYQLRMLLGISSRYEFDGFLKDHQVFDYTIEDFEKDLAGIREVREKQKAGGPARSSSPTWALSITSC